MATGPDSELDLASELNAYRAANPGTSTKSQPIVPLWKIRSQAKVPVVKARGGMDSSEWDAEGSGPRLVPPSDAQPGNQYGTQDAAENQWLDMSESDRREFMALAQSIGLVGDTPSPADLYSAWAKAVQAAQSYNSTQSDKGKWLSPWEAIGKMAMKGAAGSGSGYSGFVGTRKSKSVNKRVYTLQEVQAAANSIARDALGRDLKPEELQAALSQINRASELSPEVSDTTQTTDANGNTSSTTTNSGGIDPNAIVQDAAKKNPEYARVQAGMTYFKAAMSALDAVA